MSSTGAPAVGVPVKDVTTATNPTHTLAVGVPVKDVTAATNPTSTPAVGVPVKDVTTATNPILIGEPIHAKFAKDFSVFPCSYLPEITPMLGEEDLGVDIKNKQIVTMINSAVIEQTGGNIIEQMTLKRFISAFNEFQHNRCGLSVRSAFLYARHQLRAANVPRRSLALGMSLPQAPFVQNMYVGAYLQSVAEHVLEHAAEWNRCVVS